MICINQMSSFFSCLFLHSPQKVSFLFSQFLFSQFKIRDSSSVQESDGWALTQEMGGSKSMSLLRSPGISRAAVYHRNEQTLQVFLCLEFGSKTNLGTGVLRELWSDALAIFVRIGMLYTIYQNIIQRKVGKNAMEDTVGFLTKYLSLFLFTYPLEARHAKLSCYHVATSTERGYLELC